MDPSYASSDDEADAMAAAIGFSSFGTQRSSKKRKFNPKSDAYIEGQELATVDKGGKKGQGSGGNQIPLGRSRTFGVRLEASEGAVINEEEIPLDDDEGPHYIDEDDEGPRYINTSRPPPIMEGNADGNILDRGEEHASSIVDTSLPPPGDAARKAQEKIDAILAATEGATSDSSRPPIMGKQKQQPKKTHGAGLGAFMAALKTPVVIPSVPGMSVPPATTSPQRPPPGLSLPQRPPPVSPSTTRSAEGSVAGSHRPGHRGQRNDLWFIGYYDHSFNENPWKLLEQANGLLEVGTWIERPQGGRGHTA